MNLDQLGLAEVLGAMVESLTAVWAGGIGMGRTYPDHKLTDRRNFPIRCGPASTGS